MPVINHFYRVAANKKAKNSGCTNPGDKFRIEYVREDDEFGTPHLVESGKVDIQAENNSNEVESFSSMVNRYLRGDMSALGDPSSAMYGDFSNLGDLETINDNYVAAVASAEADALDRANSVAAEVSDNESEVKDNGES